MTLPRVNVGVCYPLLLYLHLWYDRSWDTYLDILIQNDVIAKMGGFIATIEGRIRIIKTTMVRPRASLLNVPYFRFGTHKIKGISSLVQATNSHYGCQHR